MLATWWAERRRSAVWFGLTGIVVVPKDDLDSVLARAEKFLEMDLEMQQSLKAGKSFAQAAAAADYI